MDRPKLKPCPFCGYTPNQANIQADENQGTKWGGVICPCGVRGPEVRTGYGPVNEWAESAINAWNERTAPVVVITDEMVERGILKYLELEPGEEEIAGVSIECEETKIFMRQLLTAALTPSPLR